MAKKEATFRGKTLNELMNLSNEEFAKLITARARKSLLKGFDKKVDKKIEKARKELKEGKNPKPIRTHKRNLVIIPKMVGLKFGIHKGNEFEVREITLDMLGHFLGELALTRKKLVHGKAGIGATRSSTAITARG